MTFAIAASAADGPFGVEVPAAPGDGTDPEVSLPEETWPDSESLLHPATVTVSKAAADNAVSLVAVLIVFPLSGR
ncbi:MAG TPA: hypothetical protein VG502_08830 [Flexivirga sp.]|uniref:hypothetical protein n=1 Tax=Flexivirga sp. TaxID=1962927 RepID=UPI002BECEEBD|nr:hypothetical protein [Flexivirga sp.]HWC22387.1 hypothetical protein [Flexivirga sp.]